MTNFIYQIGSLLTRLLNVALGGDANMTTSARAYLRDQQGSGSWGLFRKFIDLLFKPFEPTHCARTWDDRVARAKETIALSAKLTGE